MAEVDVYVIDKEW